MNQNNFSENIFFVGAGNMGGAILRGLLTAGYPAQKISFFEPNESLAQQIEKLGAVKKKSFADGYAQANVLILCTKPQIFNKLPNAWKNELGIASMDSFPKWNEKKCISIMAGVTRQRLIENLGDGEILRVMPNLPLTVGKGTVALATDGVLEETLALAETIFNTVGTTCRVQESLLDAVTGLSGSAPAYVFEFIEGLVRGGVKMGLSRDIALQLTLGTIEGSVELVKQSGKSPADLCAMVCSPAGTTIAGIQELEKAGFRSTLMKTVEAGTKRSKELG